MQTTFPHSRCFAPSPALRVHVPRHKYEYTHNEHVNPPTPWQLEELEVMWNSIIANDGCANWNEMGCMKTSTGLWLIQRYMRENEVENPNVLIVTTRSGKGTFFQLAPHILEGWTIINVNTQSLGVIKDGKETILPPSKLKYIPEKFEFPTLVVCHYQMFSRSNKGEFEYNDDGSTKKNANGGVIMKPPTQADLAVKRRWDFRWLDEAHRIKNKDGKWSVVIDRTNRKDAGPAMVSTGTGFINRPHEIWNELYFIDKENTLPYWDFIEQYVEIDETEGYRKIVGVKPEMKQEFRELVRSYGPRRTLNEVMPHIKEPIFVEHLVDLNPTQRRMYDQLKMELQTLDQKGEPIHSPNVLALLQRLRGICVATPEVAADYYDERLEKRVQKIKLVEPSSKLDAVMEIMDGLEWDDEKKSPVVIFSNFVGPLMLLQARFEKANRNALEMGFEPEYPYLWMKATDDDETRFDKWSRLFPSMQYRVFMSTVQLGGESINLTPARHCIFLDRSWSPKDNMQAIGRIRRPGQEGQPVVININARNTTDQYVKAVNDLKQGWFNDIFGSDDA